MNIWMEQNMLETGKKIDNKDMEQKRGQMGPSMKEIMKMEKNMASGHLDGLMALYILGNSKIIIYMVKVFIRGLIIENMKENGD